MRYSLYILTIILSALLVYFCSYNLILTILIFLVLIIYFIFLEYSLKKRIIPKKIKNNDLNIFLHDFLLSYLDHSEIKFSLKKANINISNNLKEEIRLLDEYSGPAILTNLESYFNSSLYSLFLIVIQTKNENHLDNIKFVLDENSRIATKKEEIRRQNRKALRQFIFLWVISFLVLLILRLSLNNYFSTLKNSFFYLIGISIYFLIFFLSINLFAFLFYKREVINE